MGSCRKMMMPLRSSAALRLSLAYTACMTLGIVLLWGVVFWTMHHTFRQQLDADLASEAQRLAGEYRAGGMEELEEAISARIRLHTSSEMFYALYDRRGHKLAGNLPRAMPPLGHYDLEFIDPKEGGDRARADVRELPDGLRLVVASDNERMGQIDRTMLSSFAVALAGIFLLGGLGTVLFARLLRERLGRIAHQAHAIADGVVSARMPVSARNDEFDALAESLNHMLGRIEALVVNLREVSGALAHDLRTPLSRLRQRIEVASALSREEAVRDQLELATDEVEEVLALFGSILHLSEVESGSALPMKAVDLGELVREIGESYEPVLAETGRTLQWNIAAQAVTLASRSLIAQALSNLVENALRHTPVGTAVTIHLTRSAQDIRLAVCDTGPGIADNDRKRAL